MASHVAPATGDVGLMTRAKLLSNVVEMAEQVR